MTEAQKITGAQKIKDFFLSNKIDLIILLGITILAHIFLPSWMAWIIIGVVIFFIFPLKWQIILVPIVTGLFLIKIYTGISSIEMLNWGKKDPTASCESWWRSAKAESECKNNIALEQERLEAQKRNIKKESICKDGNTFEKMLNECAKNDVNTPPSAPTAPPPVITPPSPTPVREYLCGDQKKVVTQDGIATCEGSKCDWAKKPTAIFPRGFCQKPS